MKRNIMVILLLIVAGIVFFLCKHAGQSNVLPITADSVSDSDVNKTASNLSTEGKMAPEEIDKKLPRVKTNSLNNQSGYINKAGKASEAEIGYVMSAFSRSCKSFKPASHTRILKFVGDSPTPADILILLSRQCNYYQLPNVCIEDERYFYAWREGHPSEGSIIDKATNAVTGWSIKNDELYIYCVSGTGK